jgi:hypothetical protein
MSRYDFVVRVGAGLEKISREREDKREKEEEEGEERAAVLGMSFSPISGWAFRVENDGW